MDVYLVPIGRDRFECYYEAPDVEEPEPAHEPGFFGRMKARFQGQLRDAERARHRAPVHEPATLLNRLQTRSMRWIAERIAEQRLLWHLRTAVEATLHIPTDLERVGAEQMMRESMRRDADRHLKLFGVHTGLLLLVAPVAVVPGPNALGYLFTFTVVGHFLAWRGARRGLSGVRWDVRVSEELTTLRRAFLLDAAARHHEIRAVANRLHMPRMAKWVERMATPTA